MVNTTANSAKAVFFDKDGTLVEDVPYNVAIDKIRFIDGAFDCLLALQKRGYRIFIISNQAGVALNYFSIMQLNIMRDYIYSKLESHGIHLDGFFYCPHHPQGTVPDYTTECKCRKPSPGMLYRASMEHGVDLRSCWFVGDILNDVEAGNRAGCRTILLDSGGETEWLAGPYRIPNYVVPSLQDVSRIILTSPVRKEVNATLTIEGPAQ